MKASKGIIRKIWFSLSILVIGYFFSMVMGFLGGQKTESQLLNVSERRFPIAQKSEMVNMAFKEYVRHYSNAIMIGDSAQIDMALEEAGEVRRFLREITDLIGHGDPMYQDVLKTIKDLDAYERKAEPVYRKLSADFSAASADPAITEKVRALVSQTNILQKRLEDYTIQFSGDLKKDLAAVSHTSQQQRYLNFFVFIVVVVCSTLLIKLIISRSILIPLQKTLMLEKVVERFVDGIAVTNTSDKIWFVNQAWADMHGYTATELKDQKMEFFHTHEQVKSELIPFDEVVQKEGINTGEMSHKRKDGFVFRTYRTTSKMLDKEGQTFCTVTSVRDITLQKLREEELHRAKNQAEAASITKSNFLANISHEIRTPLNGVMGMLNLLLTTDLDEEQLDLVDTGKDSADGLLTVISDILDFSKVEAGKLDMEIIDFDLRNTLEDMIELPAMHAHGKGLEFTYVVAPEIPYCLQGDPGRLRQIILNLTNNAIKFTEKGEILLQATLEEENDSDVKLRFEVKDTGIGLASDKLAKVFESFEQSDTSSTRIYGGVGLGLSISKKLVELMHGEIGVESELSKGSTFWFTTRFEKQSNISECSQEDATEKPALITRPALAENARKETRILIAEDNIVNQNLMVKMVEKYGFKADVAANGKEAVSMLKQFSYQIVLMDVQMPIMDGFKATKTIRNPQSKVLNHDVPIVALTAHAMPGDREICLEAGMNDYLTKPVNPKDLLSTIERNVLRQDTL